MRTSLVALALAACGTPDPVFTDAGPVDATSFDADTRVDAAVDGPAASVTVQVSQRFPQTGRPAAGVIVLFQDAAGVSIARAITDAAGVARGPVAAGGSVTVVETARLTTVTEVADGDVILVGDGLPTGAPAGTASLTLPTRPAGTTRIEVVGDCAAGVGAQTVNLQLSDGCGPGPHPLLVTALQDEVPRGFIYAPAVDLSSGAASLAGPWTAPAPVAVSAINRPPDLDAVGWFRVMTAGRGRAGGGASNIDLETGVLEDEILGPSTVGADFHHLLVQSQDQTLQGIARTFATVPTEVVFDLDELLPLLSGVALAQGVFSWTTASPVTVDATIVSVVALDGTGARTALWTIMVGPGRTQVALPTLPADLAGRWAPVTMRAQVSLIDSDPLGPADLRAIGFAEALYGLIPFDPARPGRGRSSSRAL